MEQKCFECDAPASQEHHVVPRSVGGKRTLWLCERCHGLVHGLAGDGDHRTLMAIGRAKVRHLQRQDVEDYRDIGFTISGTARALNVNARSLHTFLRKNGITWPECRGKPRGGRGAPGRSDQPHFSAATAEQVLALRAQGLEWKAVAAALGCSVTTAWQRVKGISWAEVKTRGALRRAV